MIYTRKVVSDRGVTNVPAGTYENVLYVEEDISIADLQDEIEPNKFWLAPNVGVIKYEYFDPVLDMNRTYELREFSK